MLPDEHIWHGIYDPMKSGYWYIPLCLLNASLLHSFKMIILLLLRGYVECVLRKKATASNEWDSAIHSYIFFSWLFHIIFFFFTLFQIYHSVVASCDTRISMFLWIEYVPHLKYLHACILCRHLFLAQMLNLWSDITHKRGRTSPTPMYCTGILKSGIFIASNAKEIEMHRSYV